MADFPDDELDILPDEGQDLLPGDEEQGMFEHFRFVVS